jgi:alkylated DNA repair dioxygenase AlkB
MQRLPDQSELFQPATEPRPAGLVYAAEFISPAEERSLLAVIERLTLHEAQYKQFTARRRIASFGGQYDFSTNLLEPAPDLPASLEPLRAKVAEWVSLPSEQFVHAMVAEYQPGTPLGWHRDVPQFEVIVRPSFASCVFYFALHPVGEQHADAECRLPPVVVDQAFAITGEELHITFEAPVQREAPVQLKSAPVVSRLQIVAYEQ